MIWTLPDEYKFCTLAELLEKRTEILSRPFPQGYSGEERRMMDWLEEHCTDNFMRALEFINRHEPCMGCSGNDMLACGEDKCVLVELEKVK